MFSFRTAVNGEMWSFSREGKQPLPLVVIHSSKEICQFATHLYFGITHADKLKKNAANSTKTVDILPSVTCSALIIISYI